VSKKCPSTTTCGLPAVKEQATHSWGFLLSITASVLQRWTEVSSPWEKSTQFTAGPEGPAPKAGNSTQLFRGSVCSCGHTGHRQRASCFWQRPGCAPRTPTFLLALWHTQPTSDTHRTSEYLRSIHSRLWRCSGGEKGPHRPGGPRTPFLRAWCQPLLASWVLLRPPHPLSPQLLKCSLPVIQSLQASHPPATVLTLAPGTGHLLQFCQTPVPIHPCLPLAPAGTPGEEPGL